MTLNGSFYEKFDDIYLWERRIYIVEKYVRIYVNIGLMNYDS